MVGQSAWGGVLSKVSPSSSAVADAQNVRTDGECWIRYSSFGPITCAPTPENVPPPAGSCVPKPQHVASAKP